MSVNKISSLPLELLTSICSHLSRKDQRAIRLVSHHFNTAAQTLLFRIIFLKLNLRSFKYLQQIANHEGLSKHVRAICFDPRQLREPAWSVGFDYWCDHILGTGMKAKPNNAVRGMSNSHDMQALHGYFLGYKNFMEGFKSLVSRGKWRGMLYYSIQQLPGLSEIYYTEGTSHSPRRLVVDLNDGLDRMEPDPSFEREICAVPSLPSSYDTGFWTLLKVISGTNCASNITKISGLDIESQAWSQNSTELQEVLRKFPNLRDLALTFENSNATYTEDYVHVPEILATATNLQSLTLRIRYGRNPGNPGYHRRSLGLRDVIPSPSQAQAQPSQWPHLQRLDLYGLIITESDLYSLVTSHSSTLRYLRLSHVEIHPSSLPRKYDRQTWVRILASLVVQAARLECVVFDAVTIATNVVGDESVVEDEEWRAVGVRAGVAWKYPLSEEFVRLWRKGSFRNGLGVGDCREEAERRENGDDERVVVQRGEIVGGVESCVGVLRDWIFRDKGGAF